MSTFIAYILYYVRYNTFEELKHENTVQTKNSIIKWVAKNPSLQIQIHLGERSAFKLARTHILTQKESLPQLVEGMFQITEEDRDMIEDLLQGHHLFYKVKNIKGKEIINKLEKFVAEPGETIFKKGDPANYFYIIVEGVVQISGFAEGFGPKNLARGQCFGDLSIQNKTNRSGTAVATTAVQLLGLRRNNFLRVSMELIRSTQNQIFKQIKNMPIFSFLNMHQKHKISFLAQELRFPKGTYIFRRGQSADTLYVIRQGKVRFDIPSKQSIEITSKHSFGQSSLKQHDSFRCADAVCAQDCILLAFNKHDMTKHLGKSLQEIQFINKIIWSLKRNQFFGKISHIILDAILNSKQVKGFKHGQVVAWKGQAIQNLIISLEGGINDKPELQLFNHNYIKGLKFHTEDLVKQGEGLVALISIQQIQEKFNRKFDLLLNIDHMISKEIQSYIVVKQYTKTLTLDKFKVAEVKGIGLYGPTLKVRSDSNIEFAMKVYKKAKVIQDFAHESVHMLRTINVKISHNLIAKTYRIYNDSKNIYFLNRYVGGESLRDCLSKNGKLPLSIIRHFSACMINTLEYLHCKRILWRQMKIESFMIDWDGYVNLIDLMYLQELKQDEYYVDPPPSATLYYLSPQTLKGQGYGLQSDFWALGVIIYKMAVGQFPFGQHINQEDPSILDVLSDQITSFHLKLPPWVPLEVKLLLKILLNPNPLQRSLISINLLKSMTIFVEYDWLGLMEKNMKNLPYIPKKSTIKINPDGMDMEAWIAKQHSETPSNDCLDDLQDI